jgi:predicted ATPase/DNA-binding SARP family transcriptional activator
VAGPTEQLEVRILGPLEVISGGARISLGGYKQRAVLALLATRAGSAVSADELIESLWGDQPPPTATTTVQVYVSRLRKLLGAERIETTGGGYVLRLDPEQLDVARFRRLSASGRAEEGLALWRGPALADFVYESWSQPEAARLEEERLACVEERIDSDLEAGRHAELVGELDALVGEHPLRERLRGQLMLALYRAGRQAEALEAYQGARSTLVEELGIEPSPQLQELNRNILQQDVSPPPGAGKRDLPTGTVTLLATDIEGSTQLLAELGAEAYADALAEHRRVLREAVTDYGGAEVDTQGDAFLVAFTRASDAAAAAADAQRELARGPMRVRMGLHTGEPLLTDAGYVGVDVHRVARIMSAGHGGQALVSHSTRDLLDERFELRDLGAHRLKDLTAPQRLYQLGGGGFPPLKTLHQSNLPVQPTSLVGRTRELREVIELLSHARLVTLTGEGGSGKTRLALQVGAELIDDFPDGVWWIPLAAVSDPALVAPNIMQTVGAKDDLLDHLRRRRALLLVDNFEHVLDAAPGIAALLAGAPEVSVLVTSRERLSLRAEHEFPVPPMADDEAAALFTARARQLRPDFEPDQAVAEICRRLSGLPLAVELAAARAKFLRPAQILDRLARSLDVLVTGARDVPERQRTLRAAIDWSYDLLDEYERRLFAALSVFAGSFDIEAAEIVSDADPVQLVSLVDKSLLRQGEHDRFFMLETIREYAFERQAESGRDPLQRRHVDYFLGVAEELKFDVRYMETAAMTRVEDERDNLRAAVAWTIAHDEKELAERFLCSLWSYWIVRGMIEEGDTFARQIIELNSPSPPALSAEALGIAAEFPRYRGDFARAAKVKEACINALRALPESEWLAPALADLAHIEARRGNFESAWPLAHEALELRRRESRHVEGRKGGVAHALAAVANIEFRQKDFEAAERTLEEVVEGHQGEELISDIPEDLAALGQVRRCLGKRAGAVATLREGLTLAVEIGNKPALCECLEVVAQLAAEERRPADAAKLWGVVERLRPEVGFGDFFDDAEHERLVALARSQLGEETFVSVLREGSDLDLDLADAVEYALAGVGSGTAP